MVCELGLEGPGAESTIVETLRVDPNAVDGWLCLARLEIRQGNLEAGRFALARAKNLDPLALGQILVTNAALAAELEAPQTPPNGGASEPNGGKERKSYEHE